MWLSLWSNSRAFSSPQRIPTPCRLAVSHHSPFPQPVAAASLLSVSLNCLFQTFYTNGPFWLPSFTWRVFTVYLGCSLYQCSISFYYQTIFQCVDILHFIYPVIIWRTMGANNIKHHLSYNSVSLLNSHFPQIFLTVHNLPFTWINYLS